MTVPDADAARPTTATVVVAHPSHIGRLALRMLLESHQDLEVVGDAVDVHAGARLARELLAAFLVVHDSLLRHHRTGPLPVATQLVVLGLEAHPAAAAAAERNGASAYVLWDRADEDLPAMLRQLSS